MKTDIYIESESEEDREVIDALSAAREYGLEESDMSREELAVVFNQFAIGLMKEQGTLQEPSHTCPECGESIEDVDLIALGVDPTVQPCGCTVSFDDLPEELYMNDS